MVSISPYRAEDLNVRQTESIQFNTNPVVTIFDKSFELFPGCENLTCFGIRTILLSSCLFHGGRGFLALFAINGRISSAILGKEHEKEGFQMTRKPGAKTKKSGASAGETKRTTPKKSATLQSGRESKGALKDPAGAPKSLGLKVGQKAPTFTLPNQEGRMISLSDFKGKKVVLYFYPKDDTPGCTKESCAFRDGLDEIQVNGAVVIGVSPDSVASHKKFAKKFDLNFPLLSDEGKSMLKKYGVWKQKSMYGRTYLGVERTTFIIGVDGKINEIFSKVKVENHLEEVLGELDVMP